MAQLERPADGGLTQMRSNGPSQTAMAAQRAMQRARWLKRSAMFLGVIGIIAALLWAGLWLFVNSDWALGRLSVIHLPDSVRLDNVTVPAAGATGEGSTAVVEDFKEKLAMSTSQAQMSDTAVSVFERDKDLERLRQSLLAQSLSQHHLSYLLGQAIVVEAGKRRPSAGRSEELKSHVDAVRRALASGAFVDGRAHPVYAMEVAAYGNGTTGEAGDIQRHVDDARRIFSKLNRGWLLVGWCTALLLLLIAMGVALDRGRALTEAADPASAGKAVERFTARLTANPHQVPFVRTSDSMDIEATIQAIELACGGDSRQYRSNGWLERLFRVHGARGVQGRTAHVEKPLNRRS